MIIVIAGAILLTLGPRMFRLLAVPVFFLVLMLPLPLPIYERIALPLQRLAAAATATVLRGFGIPALRDGNVVELTGRSLEVVDACSGMRSLSGFIALGVAFAYLSHRPLWERVVLVVSTIPIAICVNILRVTLTALLSHWGFNSLAEGTPHAGTALVLFALSALILWGEYYVLSHLFVPVEPLPQGG
jgi:exosortase